MQERCVDNTGDVPYKASLPEVLGGHMPVVVVKRGMKGGRFTPFMASNGRI